MKHAAEDGLSGHSDDLPYFVGNNRKVIDFSGICWETLQTAGLESASR
jgi:hypothetical protein